MNDFTSKVPVVKLTDTQTSLNVVIGISSDSSIQTSKLLQLYSMADPRVQKLVIVLRYWAKVCKPFAELDDSDNATVLCE